MDRGIDNYENMDKDYFAQVQEEEERRHREALSNELEE